MSSQDAVDDFEIGILEEFEGINLGDLAATQSTPPPKSIEIPALAKTRSAATMTTPTSHTASMDDDLMEGGSFGDQSASKNADFSMDDALDSGRFPTEATDANEASDESKGLSVDGLSRQELMDMVETLYENLKKADRALVREQSRRGAREKSLVSLARQLRKHKETLASYLNHIDELQEEVQVARSERSLMEQRIDYLLAQNTSRTEGGLSHLATQLKEAQDRYDLTVRHHERDL